MAEDQNIYTTEQVAKILHVTEPTIRKWISAKKLKAFRLGREWRIERNELEAFVRESYL